MAEVGWKPSQGSAKAPGVSTVTWSGINQTDTTGTAYESNAGDRSVQVTGDFGAASELPIQGSNDGSNWATLTDTAGNPAAFTVAGIKQVMPFTRYIRPGAVTSADGDTDLVVTLTERGS